MQYINVDKKKHNSYLIQSSNGIEILYNRYLVPDLLKCCNYLITYWFHLPKILLQVFVFIFKAAHTNQWNLHTSSVLGNPRPWPAGTTSGNQLAVATAADWRARVFLNFSWISRRSRLQHKSFFQAFSRNYLARSIFM